MDYFDDAYFGDYFDTDAVSLSEAVGRSLRRHRSVEQPEPSSPVWMDDDDYLQSFT